MRTILSGNERRAECCGLPLSGVSIPDAGSDCATMSSEMEGTG
jgi:hypothetical protein